MDFFQAQEDARRRSTRLLVLFAAAVVGMIVVVYATVLVLFAWTAVPAPGGRTGLVHPPLLLAVATGMLVLIGGGSAWRTAQLRSGGGAVARMLGGRPVAPDSTDFAEVRFRNVVEEMALAAGTPVPEMHVLDQEAGMNAFAAGHTLHDAAVAVTRGTLEGLDRDELQGVVAHEFSHIVNGDMRLNLRLIGLLHGILLLTVVGRGILRASPRRMGGRNRGGGQTLLLGLVLLLLGSLGVFFGRMIQAAVSRQREFLADAAAVQFTRNPNGIAGALRKIAAGSGSQVRSANAPEVGHLFFASGVRGFLQGLFATHPPIDERIRRIEGALADLPSEEGVRAARAVSGADDGQAPSAGWAGFAAGVGRTDASDLARARSLLESVPDPVRHAAHDPDEAPALVLALLLAPDPTLRDRQLRTLGEAEGASVAKADTHLRALGAGRRRHRLALADLTLPALRALPQGERDALRRRAAEFIRMDGRVDPFEFALFHLLRRNLAQGEARVRRRVPLGRLETEVRIVLSALARAGSSDEAAVEVAYRRGAQTLFGARVPEAVGRPVPATTVGLEAVDRALDRLGALPPKELRTLVRAASETVSADGRLDGEELELLRAVSEALGVPVGAGVG